MNFKQLTQLLFICLFSVCIPNSYAGVVSKTTFDQVCTPQKIDHTLVGWGDAPKSANHGEKSDAREVVAKTPAKPFAESQHACALPSFGFDW